MGAGVFSVDIVQRIFGFMVRDAAKLERGPLGGAAVGISEGSAGALPRDVIKPVAGNCAR
jgi:hypothetical protein